ncbi:LppU/SCO3897 family protein [Micromonospora taraxaci]|uniref:LppU/SCO3897 family protein n=1 Tax=Micromonospora taraxaci TaxID=1316803 RepID=UPI0033A0D4B7
MPEQVAPPSAPDAAAPQPAVETPQPTPAQPETAKPDEAAPDAAAPNTPAPDAAAPNTPAPDAAAPNTPAPNTPAPDAAAPNTPAPNTPAPDAATPEAEKSGGKKALGIIGAILAVVVIAGLKFGVASAIGNYFNKDETADAKVGDCIAELPEVTGTEQEEVDGAKVVSCTSTDAAYTVVGRVNDQSQAQAQAGTACDQFFKEGEEGYVFSSIEPGKTGYVLCLTKKA